MSTSAGRVSVITLTGVTGAATYGVLACLGVCANTKSHLLTTTDTGTGTTTGTASSVLLSRSLGIAVATSSTITEGYFRHVRQQDVQIGQLAGATERTM